MKSSINKILLFVVSLVRGASDFIEIYVKPSIKYLEIVKRCVDNPNMDFIVATTKTDIDNTTLRHFRSALHYAIAVLCIPGSSETPSWDMRIKCYIDYLRSLSPELRSAVLAKTASRMAQHPRAGFPETHQVFSESDVDLFVQLAYNSFKPSK